MRVARVKIVANCICKTIKGCLKILSSAIWLKYPFEITGTDFQHDPSTRYLGSKSLVNEFAASMIDFAPYNLPLPCLVMNPFVYTLNNVLGKERTRQLKEEDGKTSQKNWSLQVDNGEYGEDPLRLMEQSDFGYALTNCLTKIITEKLVVARFTH